MKFHNESLSKEREWRVESGSNLIKQIPYILVRGRNDVMKFDSNPLAHSSPEYVNVELQNKTRVKYGFGFDLSSLDMTTCMMIPLMADIIQNSAHF